jgi:hypothetical protein
MDSGGIRCHPRDNWMVLLNTIHFRIKTMEHFMAVSNCINFMLSYSHDYYTGPLGRKTRFSDVD